jgi:hypothetical protein
MGYNNENSVTKMGASGVKVLKILSLVPVRV